MGQSPPFLSGKYADRRGHRVAVIQGSDEIAQRTCQLKDLRTGESTTISLAESTGPLLDAIARILAGSKPAD